MSRKASSKQLKRRALLALTVFSIWGGCSLQGTLSALAADAPDAELKRAIGLYQGKDYRNAMTAFHKIASAKKSATPTYYLGMCYLNLKYHDQAIDVFKRVTEQWPDSPEAKLAKDYLRKLEGMASSVDESNEKLKALKDELDSRLPAETRELRKPITKSEWMVLPGKTRFPFSKEHGHLMVQAKINQKICKVAFDTGAAVCTISEVDFPDVIPLEDLRIAGTVTLARPHGASTAKIVTAEVSLGDITRKVKVCVTREPGVNVIGQNFFREYSYAIDDFYVRLAKEPYKDDSIAEKTKLSQVVGLANQGAKSPVKVPSSTKNMSTRDIAVMLQEAESHKTAERKKGLDKFSLPFEKMGEVMLVDIESKWRED